MDVTSTRGQFPARPLSVDLNKVDVAATGFWWCLRCHRVTELLDSDVGLSGRRCVHCHSLKIEWKPSLQATPAPVPEPLPQWATAEPDAGRKAQKRHRLAPEKRDLRLLARTGYWFCYGCQEVTERDKKERCVLCRSDRVEWNDPVFAET